MPGSQYFSDKQKKSLNSFNETEANWRVDQKYLVEVSETLKRAQVDISDGILTKFAMMRTRQLEQQISETCY